MENEAVVKQCPQWLLKLLQDLLDMRDAQKEFFEAKSDYRKKVAIAKEQKADQWLERAVKAGLICHKPKPENKNQSTLF